MSKPALATLTVECPSCNRPYLMDRSRWPSKRSGEPLDCRGCGAETPTRKWTLMHVPWLRVVEEGV